MSGSWDIRILVIWAAILDFSKSRPLPYPLVLYRLMIHKNDQQTKPYNFCLRCFDLKWLLKNDYLSDAYLCSRLVPCWVMIYQNDQQIKPYNFWKRRFDLKWLFKFPKFWTCSQFFLNKRNLKFWFFISKSWCPNL